MELHSPWIESASRHLQTIILWKCATGCEGWHERQFEDLSTDRTRLDSHEKQRPRNPGPLRWLLL